jgi:fatty-acyl-CoA synthase
VRSDDHYVRQMLTQFDEDPQRTAVICGGARATAGELADAVRRAAQVMRRHGIARGGVVAVLTNPNTPATLVLRWAANLLGATVAHVRGVNAVNPGDELPLDVQRGIVAGIRADLIAVDADNVPRARDLAGPLSPRPALAALGAFDPDVADLTAGSGEDIGPDPGITEADIAVVTFTSGSSGRPKGVSWTFAVKNEMAAASRSRGGRASCLITAPLTHSSGFSADDTLITGGLVVLHHGFDAGEVLRAVAEHRITRLVLGTPQVYALAAHPGTATTDLSSISELFYTGSPAAPNRIGAAAKVFGPVLFQVYGTSETGLISLLLPHEHDDPTLRATVGRPPETVKVSIQDPEDGRIQPPGLPGEICVIGRWSMARYWNEPDLTARAIRDGWVRTGDIGYLDEAGYLHLSGRLADVIKVRGIKVHPEDVERVLNEHPGVAQAAVFGVEDSDRVERIQAVIIPRPGAAVDVEELHRQVTGALSANHVPDVIEIRAELPLVGAAKPDRARLRAEARAAIGSLQNTTLNQTQPQE